jgi:hypothetical protein
MSILRKFKNGLQEGRAPKRFFGAPGAYSRHMDLVSSYRDMESESHKVVANVVQFSFSDTWYVNNLSGNGKV